MHITDVKSHVRMFGCPNLAQVKKTTNFNFVRTKNILKILQEHISNIYVFIRTKNIF